MQTFALLFMVLPVRRPFGFVGLIAGSLNYAIITLCAIERLIENSMVLSNITGLGWTH